MGRIMLLAVIFRCKRRSASSEYRKSTPSETLRRFRWKIPHKKLVRFSSRARDVPSLERRKHQVRGKIISGFLGGFLDAEPTKCLRRCTGRGTPRRHFVGYAPKRSRKYRRAAEGEPKDILPALFENPPLLEFWIQLPGQRIADGVLHER